METKNGVTRQENHRVGSFPTERRKKKVLFDYPRALAEEKYVEHKICSNVPDSQLIPDNLWDLVAYISIKDVHEADVHFFGFESDAAVDTTPASQNRIIEESDKTTTVKNQF